MIKHSTGLVQGVGMLDLTPRTKEQRKAYSVWIHLLKVCYCKEFLYANSTYKECKLVRDWLRFSKFLVWFDSHYIPGLVLSKDILGYRSKVYGPETCCFISKKLKAALHGQKVRAGKLPCGLHKSPQGSINVVIGKHGKTVHLGSVSTVAAGVALYAKAKSNYIKEIVKSDFAAGNLEKHVCTFIKQLPDVTILVRQVESIQRAEPDAKKPYLIFGVGLLDIKITSKLDKDIYNTWHSIFRRVHTNKHYLDCRVSKRWHKFSNFHSWYLENYTVGYEIDKDILKPGNRVYGPKYCRFVSHRINMLLAARKDTKHKRGVSLNTKTGKFVAHLYVDGVQTHLGTFDNENDASTNYMQAKASYIKRVACEHQRARQIAADVFDALVYRAEAHLF